MKTLCKWPVLALVLASSGCGEDMSGGNTLAVTGVGARRDADEHVVRVHSIRGAKSFGSLFKPVKIELTHSNLANIDGPNSLETIETDQQVRWFVKPASKYKLRGAVSSTAGATVPLSPADGFAFDVEAAKKDSARGPHIFGFDGTQFFKRGYGVLLTAEQRRKLSTFVVRFDRRDTEVDPNASDAACGTGETFTVSVGSDGRGQLHVNRCLDAAEPTQEQKEKFMQTFAISALDINGFVEAVAKLDLRHGKGSCEKISSSQSSPGATTTQSWQTARYLKVVVDGLEHRYARDGGACDTSWFDGIVPGDEYFALRNRLRSLAKLEQKIDNLKDSNQELWARIEAVCSAPFMTSSVKGIQGFAASPLAKLCEEAKLKVQTPRVCATGDTLSVGCVSPSASGTQATSQPSSSSPAP